MNSIDNYPLQIRFTPSEKVRRWRVFVAFFLSLPLLIILGAFGYLIGVLWFMSFFAILFTGKIPAWFLDAISSYYRFQAQAYSVALFLRDDYPKIGFAIQSADPGDSDVVYFDVKPDLARSRIKAVIFVRALLMVPHFITALGAQILTLNLVVVSWFFALVFGRWPRPLQRWVLALISYQFRLGAYFSYVTDAYPPFAIA